jgi:hypothetical protein
MYCRLILVFRRLVAGGVLGLSQASPSSTDRVAVEQVFLGVMPVPLRISIFSSILLLLLSEERAWEPSNKAVLFRMSGEEWTEKHFHIMRDLRLPPRSSWELLTTTRCVMTQKSAVLTRVLSDL